LLIAFVYAICALLALIIFRYVFAFSLFLPLMFCFVFTPLPLLCCFCCSLLDAATARCDATRHAIFEALIMLLFIWRYHAITLLLTLPIAAAMPPLTPSPPEF